MMTRKLGPAMAAGCTSIVKPASATPLTAVAIVRDHRGRGVPAGVVNLITSRASGDGRARAVRATRASARSAFTGSTEVGKELIRAVGRPGQAAVARAGRPRAVHRVRRRRPRRGSRRHDRLEVPQRRPDLRLRQPHLRAARHLQRVHRAAWPRRVAKLSVGNGAREGVTIGPLIDDRAVDKADEHVARRARARARRLVAGGSG